MQEMRPWEAKDIPGTAKTSLGQHEDKLSCSELYVTMCEVDALLVVNPIISPMQLGLWYCRHNGIG